MPAQKRPAPPPPPDDPQLVAVDAHDHDKHGDDHHHSGNCSPPLPSSAAAQHHQQKRENHEEQQPPPPPQQLQQQQGQPKQEGDEEMLAEEDHQKNDYNATAGAADDGGSPSSSSTNAADKDDEFVLVKLVDIRKEVQCPICLGIIRKTRTVMECLHRFCRECIDKSMRLGNNECPACRTHCASRRSLRDDPNYDALISALYPDIDKYLEEELAFHEEDSTRNKKIQASIAETFRRQMEALGKRRSNAKATAAAFVRRSQGNYRSSRGQSSYQRGRSRNLSQDAGLTGSDDDDEDANDNEGGTEPSSADEQSPEFSRPKRCRRWAAPRFFPALTAVNADGVCDESDDLEVGREAVVASPGRVGNREVLVWGKGGTRSQTRHGSLGSNGKYVRGSRITKLVDYFRNLDENEDEFDVHLTLLPLDEQSLPSLQQPYLCCRPTSSVRHLCQFIAPQIAVQAEEVEILVKRSQSEVSALKTSASIDDPISRGSFNHPDDDEGGLQILEAQESLAGLHAYFSSSQGNLVLAYRSKSQS